MTKKEKVSTNQRKVKGPKHYLTLFMRKQNIKLKIEKSNPMKNKNKNY